MLSQNTGASSFTSDPVNTCAYNTEGRVCVESTAITGMGYTYTGYLYDAEGNRVAKGTHTSLTCDTSDFTMTNMYVLGPDGKTMTETDGSGTWQHTDVGLGDSMATYVNDGQGLHFQFADWLGTRRVQTDYMGTSTTDVSFQHLLFGELISPLSGDTTEKHFTDQEHDTQTGNDSFGARYLASNMGRFLSPDPSGLALADPGNPQSLNLYGYVLNNPLIFTDPSGLHYECQTYQVTITGSSSPSPVVHDCVWVDDFRFSFGRTSQFQLSNPPQNTVTGANPYAAPSTATVGPDSQACAKKAATDVVKGAIFYDQVNWLAGKLSGQNSPAADPGLPSAPGSSTIGAAKTTATFIAGSQIAQAYIRQAIRDGGGTISMRKVGSLAGTFGKYAGAIGTTLTAYSAYKDYQYCMGR